MPSVRARFSPAATVDTSKAMSLANFSAAVKSDDTAKKQNIN